MKTFSIRCKAKYLVVAVLAACTPGDDDDGKGPSDSSSDSGSDDTSGDTGTDDDGGTDTGDSDTDAPDLGDDGTDGGGDCPSLCPDTTTLECDPGSRCVPYPEAPKCEVCP